MLGIFKKKKERPKTCAIIAAAGNSSRMGGFNKLLAELNGVEVLIRSIRAFEDCDLIDHIVVVASSSMIVEYSNLISAYGLSKVSKVISGGDTRQLSVYKGLCEAPSGVAFAAVHDGARPLVTPALVAQVCEKAFEHSCALAASSATDTVKIGKDGLVVDTLNREQVFFAQTPQVCDIDLLKGALLSAIRENVAVTDECSAVEGLGVKPAIVLSEGYNLKITYPKDIALAESILAYEE